MVKIKKDFQLLTYNIGTLILFEVIYKALSILVFRPLFIYLLNVILRISGFNYLTLGNIFLFLLRPWNIALIIVLCFFMALYALFDLSTIIVVLDISRQQKKIGLFDAIKISLKKCGRIFKRGNFIMLVVLLFMMPFLQLGTASGFISTIGFPQFMLNYIFSHAWVTILVCIGMFLLFWLLVKWVFTFNYFVIEGGNYLECRTKSKRLAYKRKIAIFFVLLLMNVVHALVYAALVRICITILVAVFNIFENFAVSGILSTSVWLVIMTVFSIYEALATPITYAVISLMYYHRQQTLGDDIKHLEYEPKEKKPMTKVRGFFIIMAILVATFVTGTILGRYTPMVEYVRTVEVTAHRGASNDYPENTMAAFEGAKELGADWIELDVQQCADETPVISHDANVKRVTGVNKYIYNMTVEEIKELDAGSSFSAEFAGEQIPTLEEAVSWAKENDMKLNIEIKLTGHENELEQAVIDIINKYDFKDQCLISTQQYSVCERVKEIDEDIQTLYVLTLAIGNVLEFEAADSFGVEEQSATETMARRLHKEGKQMYVWTVNSRDGIEKMLDIGVDNIVTDSVSLAVDLVYQSRASEALNAYIKFLRSL